MELTDTPIFFSGLFLSSYTHTQTFFRDSFHSTQPNLRVGFRCLLTVSNHGGQSCQFGLPHPP